MLAQYLIDEVRALLVEGRLTTRQIAKRTGVSRGAVMKISLQLLTEPQPKPAEENDDFEKPTVPPKRCPTCGAWVYPPCRRCVTQRFLRTHPRKFAAPWNTQPIVVGLDLKPHHRSRYNKIRRRLAKEEGKVGSLKDEG